MVPSILRLTRNNRLNTIKYTALSFNRSGTGRLALCSAYHGGSLGGVLDVRGDEHVHPLVEGEHHQEEVQVDGD